MVVVHERLVQRSITAELPKREPYRNLAFRMNDMLLLQIDSIVLGFGSMKLSGTTRDVLAYYMSII